MRIKIHGYIENKATKKRENIETNAIKKNNSIVFKEKDIDYKIKIDNNNIKIIRETNDFKHELTFKLNKTINSLYYIKEYDSSMEIPLTTTKLIYNDNYLEIEYIINESQEEFKYILEMSE